MQTSWTNHAKDNVFWVVTAAATLALLWRLRAETRDGDDGNER